MADIKEEGEAIHVLPVRALAAVLTHLPGGKRKAEDEPSSPAASKRVKQDEDSVEEEAEEKHAGLKLIPFPEKVCDTLRVTFYLASACSSLV
jgi:hypothetical protein